MCQVQSHMEAVLMRKIHYISRLLSIFLGLQEHNSLRGHITSFQAIMRAYYFLPSDYAGILPLYRWLHI